MGRLWCNYGGSYGYCCYDSDGNLFMSMIMIIIVMLIVIVSDRVESIIMINIIIKYKEIT